MPTTSVVGLQWGDEAKGKLVDLLAGRHDVVVRYQGGANAGHTVVAGGEVFKLHHIPSGILTSRSRNLITAGVVLNPATLLEEIEELRGRGVSVDGDRLRISPRAHVVLPWHVVEDRVLNEGRLRGETIGTTLRGIGPCYRDKAGRWHAVRLGDLYHEGFREQLERIAEAKRRMLSGFGVSPDDDALDAAKIYDQYRGYAERLEPMVGDTTRPLLEAIEADQRVLFEGAQGTMLDIDHGTFPFVTSSNSSGLGVCAGAGVPPRWIQTVIGVAKCYTTRVGGGPFPTELHDETAQRIRDLGDEYGTTTGRPRRCGWFDAVAVRYAVRISGVDRLSLMMMDVLSQLPEVRICVAYELDGEHVDWFPAHVDDVRRVRPVYETLPGWMTDVTSVRRLEDLPAGARRFLDRLSELLERPVAVVSVGPDREQTILSSDLAG